MDFAKRVNETPVSGDVPVMEGDEMRRIDLEVTDELNFYRTMESVATRTADFIQYWIKCSYDHDIIIVAGKGNNGGNAITAGRILIGRGYKNVRLLLSHGPEAMKGIPSEQLMLYKQWGGVETNVDEILNMHLLPSTIVLDGLLGTGITRPPSGPVGMLIEEINKWGFMILSCDIPSGLNHITGEAYEPCVRAKWTLNYHVVKSGQVQNRARSHVGSLWTAETQLTFIRFGRDFCEKLKKLYADSPIVRVT